MPSPAIRAYAYDADRNELTLTFATGRAYVYSLVPPAVFAAFEAAASRGAFHNAHLRDRFPFRKVKAERPAGAGLREALVVSTETGEAVARPASGRNALQSDGNRGPE